MPVQPMTASQSRKVNVPEFYGFDPEIEYVIRSRVRDYHGVTERYRFANGQAVAPRMRADATDEQKWNRGERLSRIKGNPAYRIYERGTEWQPRDEPMWADQAPPEGQIDGEDTGEAGPGWQPVEVPGEDSKPVNRGIEPSPEGDTGEGPPSFPITQQTR